MRPSFGLWLGFVALGLGTLFSWTHQNWYPVTGDEPHYLVMADAIVEDRSFEQTAAYEREFDARTIYPGGLAPAGSTADESTTHGVEGPHGLYNVHNVGLPALISIPFLVAGKALLDRNLNPTETEVRYWLAGNLCRCTGYDKIVRAVMDTAADMRGA